MGRYFGTDGIRGKNEKFSKDYINVIGNAYSKYLLENNESPKVVIGGDTRISTKFIKDSLIECLSKNGIDIINVSILPTPAISYLTTYYKVDGSIIITASHNPASDNGIKILSNTGEKMDDIKIDIIENYMDNNNSINQLKEGIIYNKKDEAFEVYKAYLKSIIKTDFTGLNIGIDCANGAASSISNIFNELCATTTIINNDSSYSTKINENCGSTHLENLKKLVIDKNLDFGIAFDGDADRCLLIDNKGIEIDGDIILSIICNKLKKENKLLNNKIAITVMANQGLIEYAKNNNIDLEITKVGDSYVYATMKKENIVLGGEQSGHIILPNQKTGDGVLTALTICSIVKEENKSLNELSAIMKRYPQILLNINADDYEKEIFKTDVEINEIIENYNTIIVNDGGRMLIRPSGTEPLIRITIWGNNYNKIEEFANKIGSLIKNRLNSIKE